MSDHTVTLVEQVRVAAAAGTKLVLGSHLPDKEDESKSVAAEVIRDVLEGTHVPLHRRGLRLQGFRIEGDLDLSYMRWHGELTLLNCHVTGDITLDHARPVGRVCLDGSHVRWISALNAVIDGTLNMRDGFRSDTGFYGLGIRVTESLNLRRSHIFGPKSKPTRLAVELYRANIGDLFMSHACIDGGVYAAGMSVVRNVRIQGSQVRSRSDLGWKDDAEFSGAITLAGSEVRGSVYISTTSTRGTLLLAGQLQLDSVSCRQIFIHSEIFRETSVTVDGLVYTRLRLLTARELLDELMRSSLFQPQAFVQLASYCQSIGEVTTRRQVLIGLEKSITKTLPPTSPTRAIRLAHQVLVGYGYRSARAVPWLLLCILAAILLVYQQGDFLVPKATFSNPAQNVAHAPPSLTDSIAITLDNFLPFASLGVKDDWSVEARSVTEWTWLLLFLVLKFGAWGLAALALASITGIIRKTA